MHESLSQLFVSKRLGERFHYLYDNYIDWFYLPKIGSHLERTRANGNRISEENMDCFFGHVSTPYILTIRVADSI